MTHEPERTFCTDAGCGLCNNRRWVNSRDDAVARLEKLAAELDLGLGRDVHEVGISSQLRKIINVLVGSK